MPELRPERHEGSPLVGSFGNLNSSKRIPQLLEAFARLRRDRPEARLLLVGAVSPGFDLDRRLQRLGLSSDGIIREDYVDEARLWSLMAACDVCVNLRAPTMGETSGSVIRQLSLGKPVVVSDVGWFSELPDAVALKIPVGAGETETLHAALELLAGNDEARAAMSTRRARARPSRARPRARRRALCRRARAGRRRRGGGGLGAPRRRRSRRRGRDRAGLAGGDPSSRGASPRSSLGDSLRRVPAWAWLAGIVAGSIVFRAWLGSRMPAPFIFTDELQYQENARSLAAGEGIEVRGEPYGIVSVLYPLVLAPAYALFDSLPDAYAAARTINAVVMSLAAIPAFLLARRVLPTGLSLFAALLAVALPSLAYTGTLMSENAFYPAFLLAAWALVRALEQPTVARQAVLLAACGAAVLVRVQALALLLAALTAPLLLRIGRAATAAPFPAALRRRRRRRRARAGGAARARARR